VADDFDAAAETLEPSGDVVGVGDGAGEEEELELGRGGEEGALVVIAAGGIGEPVVFVDDEEVERWEIGRARGSDLGMDRFEGGDDEGGDANEPDDDDNRSYGSYGSGYGYGGGYSGGGGGYNFNRGSGSTSNYSMYNGTV
jgi:hypothetical protein